MWFNEDDDEEGKAVITPVEKSKTEDDFPDSYEKFMETKKGTNVCNFHISPLSKTIIQPEFDRSHHIALTGGVLIILSNAHMRLRKSKETVPVTQIVCGRTQFLCS